MVCITIWCSTGERFHLNWWKLANLNATLLQEQYQEYISKNVVVLISLTEAWSFKINDIFFKKNPLTMFTWIVTVGWLSAAVENICDFLVGMTVFLPISLVITPPTVSIPSVSGLTSSSTRSPVSSSPPNTPAWTAAPYATASSGLIPRLGS